MQSTIPQQGTPGYPLGTLSSPIQIWYPGLPSLEKQVRSCNVDNGALTEPPHGELEEEGRTRADEDGRGILNMVGNKCYPQC
jgi:hypothetical protein